MSRAAAKPNAPREVLPLARHPELREGAVTALWLGVAFIVSIIIGFIVMRLPGAMVAGNELSIERTLFTVINAITGAGFQQNLAIDQYGALGKACVVALMTIGTLISLIVGGLAVVRIAGMNYTDAQIVRTTIVTYLLAVFAGAALLAEPQRGLVASAVQAASAFGNSGLVLGPLPPLLDWRTHLVLMPLAVMGGLGIPVLLDIARLAFGRGGMSKHSQVVLVMMAAVYLIGIACVPWRASEWTTALASGSVQSINTRSTGLPLLSMSAVGRVGQWLAIGLMMIGAAPGSAAGGLKVTTLFQVWRGARNALARERVCRVFGIALVWIGAYVLTLALTLLGLLATQPELPSDRLLFISSSAVSLVGLSQDPISMTGTGLNVVSVAMLLGRVAPWLVLWWTAGSMRDDEADIAVG